MRVLVCGSRDFEDKVKLYWELGHIEGLTAIISGCAPGADTLALEWAEDNEVVAYAYPAEWRKYGKAAGPIRNQRMLDDGQPDLVLAFPKNGDLDATKGTKDMVARAKRAGVAVKIVN